MGLKDNILNTYYWIRNDYFSNRFRFTIELVAWMLSIGCSATMALTVPNPPLFWLYPTWILGCCMYSWAAWTRRSFGMVGNYLLLVSIDVIGFSRLIVQ